MKAIELLVNEHRLILKALDALEVYVAHLDQKERSDPKDLNLFVEFITQFADSCHHGKEEDILFEEMAQHGFPKEQGPLAVMLVEHTQGRKYVAELRRLTERTGSWSDDDRAQVFEAAMGYVQLLRSHIFKEDHILYPAAESHLSALLMDEIETRFSEFEEEKIGSEEITRLRGIAESLTKKYVTV